MKELKRALLVCLILVPTYVALCQHVVFKRQQYVYEWALTTIELDYKAQRQEAAKFKQLHTLSKGLLFGCIDEWKKCLSEYPSWCI